jgi:hypothetical protein
MVLTALLLMTIASILSLTSSSQTQPTFFSKFLFFSPFFFVIGPFLRCSLVLNTSFDSGHDFWLNLEPSPTQVPKINQKQNDQRETNHLVCSLCCF